MKFHRALKWIALALLLQFAASGLAFAEDTDTQAKETKATGLTSEENLSLIDEDIKSLSGKEKLRRAAKKIDTMRKTAESTAELLASVRNEERDIIKINCINEKHAAIKGFVKVSEQSYINLKDAVDKGDGGAADHHYTLVAVANQKVRNLAEEARMCTGEERRFTGKAQVEVTKEDTADETIDASRDDLLGEDLQELTPYQ